MASKYSVPFTEYKVRSGQASSEKLLGALSGMRGGVLSCIVAVSHNDDEAVQEALCGRG